MLKIKILKKKAIDEELSDAEKAQLGTQKKTYKYASGEEYEKLRPYLVDKSAKRNPKLDRELTAYTPGETVALLKNPKIQDWFKKVSTFKVPDKYGLVVFVGCAATKPWGMSCVKGDFYPYYNQIRADVQAGRMKPLYFVTLSEPLGIVPEEYWGDEPEKLFPQYDNPGLFNDTVLQSGMTTKAWEKSPLGSKREMPFDKKSFDEAIKILGGVVGQFVKNNSDHQFISFVEHADKSASTHSLMLDVAQQMSGVQIPRNPKKAAVGRSGSIQDVGSYTRSKLPPEYSTKS
jgi:hypothetical protein